MFWRTWQAVLSVSGTLDVDTLCPLLSTLSSSAKLFHIMQNGTAAFLGPYWENAIYYVCIMGQDGATAAQGNLGLWQCGKTLIWSTKGEEESLSAEQTTKQLEETRLIFYFWKPLDLIGDIQCRLCPGFPLAHQYFRPLVFGARLALLTLSMHNRKSCVWILADIR